MSADAGRLLVREREELDRVAEPLREGRRVAAFLVGEETIQPAALAYLRERSGVAIPEPVTLTDPDQTLDLLLQADGGKPSDVLSLRVDHTAPNVLRTLNWHREKLRRGASVLLWIDGVEGLRAVRAMAPDAYAFRDVIIAIQGEETVPVVPPEAESIDVQLARLYYSGAEGPEARAQAAVKLANVLRRHGWDSEARATLRDALATVPGDTYMSEWARIARAGMYFHLCCVTEGSVDAFRRCQCGLNEVAELTSSEAHAWRLVLLAIMPSPLQVDHRSVLQALSELQPVEEPPDVQNQVLRGAAASWTRRGDLPRAGKLLRQAIALYGPNTANLSLTFHDQGYVERTAGRIARAEEQYQAAYNLRARAGMGTSQPAFSLAICSQVRGDLDVARRIFMEIATQPDNFSANHHGARLQLADIAMTEGDVLRSLLDLRSLLHEAASCRNDGHLYNTAETYVSALRDVHEAGRLTPTDLTDADAELDVAEDVALSIARDDPPWYTILFPGLRAELLSLRPDRLSEAVPLAAGALDRARAVWPDAAPMHARMLIRHLIRAGRLDEARAALDLAIPEAEAQRHLRELARLRALSVAVLALGASPAAAIDAEVHALRATLDETGAPRIAADTLLELGLLLPPLSPASPEADPLPLLDEAAALFAEMPIPEREARCVEASGDVIAARGDPAALNRYREAKTVCERYGFGLRVPLLTRKLAQ